MRKITITRKAFKYDELSEDAKERALQIFSEINVDYEWWEWVYTDAEEIGLKITEFDIYWGRIRGELLLKPRKSILAILEKHGKVCETYKFAYEWTLNTRLKNIDEEEYKRELLQQFLSLLREEYNYSTSREAIEETIRINEYEFTENGNFPVF